VPRVLITGASGLLGANLTLEASNAGWGVVAICHQHPIQLDDVVVYCRDLAASDVPQALFRETRPDVVIHCAAATNVDACERDPELAYKLNRDMARAVAKAAKSVGAYLVHISTDAVFDGVKGNYSEEDQPRPINVYAESKLAGEQAVAKVHDGAAIVRTNLFGWNAQDKASLAEWFLHNFRRGKPFNGFVDVWFSPILVNQLARVLLRMSERRLAGVFHVAGHDCMTKYDFGCALGDAFELDTGLLQPVSVDDVNLSARRSKCLCLKVDKIEVELGEVMPCIKDGIQLMHSLHETGFKDELKRVLVTAGG